MSNQSKKQMPFWYFFYGIAWTFIVPVLALLALTLIPKWRAGLKQKLGIVEISANKDSKTKRIWFHAVSVGELNALIPVLYCFLHYDIVLSTSTSTANQMAAIKLAEQIKAAKIKLIYMPWDHPYLISSALKRIKPYALVTVETEIWPALILEAKRFGVRLAIINARLNDKSYKTYRDFRDFLKPVFASFEMVLTQSLSDTQKFMELGASRVLTLANIKFAALPIHSANEAVALRKALGYAALRLDSEQRTTNNFILLAASTHEEEEAALINIFQELRQEAPELRLILAPRHPDRFLLVEKLIDSAAQLEVIKYSQIKEHFAGRTQKNIKIKLERGLSQIDVLLVDTIGDLAALTAIADLVFVGGTIPANIGGHNVLEPASYGIPVVVGVNYSKNVETVEMMESAGALEVAESLEELKLAIKSIVQDADKRVLMGARAINAMKANRKILEDTVTKLNEFINPAIKTDV